MHTALAIFIVLLAPPVSGSRLHYMMPGRSDGLLKIGMSRGDVLKTSGKPSSTYHFSWDVISQNKSDRVRIVEDEWDRQNGDGIDVLDVLYINGKTIQIQEADDNVTLENGVYPGNELKDVLKQYKRLKLSSYGYDCRDTDGSPAGGYDGYFYDDERQGVAFYFGMQDTLEDTLATKIDGIIVHRVGFLVIPPSHGAKIASVKPDHKLTLPFLYSHMR